VTLKKNKNTHVKTVAQKQKHNSTQLFSAFRPVTAKQNSTQETQQEQVTSVARSTMIVIILGQERQGKILPPAKRFEHIAEVTCLRQKQDTKKSSGQLPFNTELQLVAPSYTESKETVTDCGLS
jgi:hypothetical protein